MTLIGPLIHCWSMPFERKNREEKLIATKTNSHKNPPLTIAIHNQLYMCYSKQKCKNAECYSKLGTIINEDIDIEIKKLIPGIVEPLYSKEYSFVKINGKKLMTGSVIVVSMEKLEPDFGIVHRICTIKGCIFLLVKLLKTLNFDKFYHAYLVNDRSFESDLIVINNDDLPKFEPCVIHTNKDGTYVASRYDL